MRQVKILIGSNAPDREARVDAALRRLPEAGVVESRRSKAVESPDFLGLGPDYLNVLVEGETLLGDDSLRSRLHAIESTLGRRRGMPGASPDAVVAVDVDLVVAGGCILKPREYASEAFARCLATLP